MKKISILGITGSIGLSAVEVIRNHPEDFQIVLASTNSNYNKLFSLAQEFSIPHLIISNTALKQEITDIPKACSIHYGADCFEELIKTSECDLLLNAISGSAGLEYTMCSIKNGIDIALANKESLVMAGHLIKDELKKRKINIIPVDSEHSAIYQAIGDTPLSQIKKLIITASGGPFRNLPLDDFPNIGLQQALDHPTWNMGNAITINSATMMNKGLEVIEAHWLFDKDYDDIEAVIHPQSIVHSLIEYADGSLLAQMSTPSMQLPILYAFTYPKHIHSNLIKTSLVDLPALTFEKVDKNRYPLFYLACESGRRGGAYPTIMNAANEAAIKLFSERKIRFTEIYKLVYHIVNSYSNSNSYPDLSETLEINQAIYEKAYRDYSAVI